MVAAGERPMAVDTESTDPLCDIRHTADGTRATAARRLRVLPCLNRNATSIGLIQTRS